MEEFAWQDAYGVNNARIDEEHKHLIALANQVDRFAKNGEACDTIRSAVHALCEYVRAHFANEEAYMEEVRFPHQAAHAALHGAIIHEMNEILRHSPSMDSLVYKLKRMVRAWVLGHIQQEDLKISLFVRGQGEQPAD